MATDHPPATEGGSLLTRKLGPLPYWAWIGLAVLALVLIVRLRSSSGGAAAGAVSGAGAPGSATDQPDTIYQDYITITPPAQPPAGGRTDTPGTGPSTGTTTPPAGGSGGSGTTVPKNPPVTAPKPTKGPVASPKPSTVTVTVAKWNASNPPWNSTLSGIAEKEGYGNDWAAIWNDPANAALVRRRKTPNLIQPGDKIVVKPKK